MTIYNLNEYELMCNIIHDLLYKGESISINYCQISKDFQVNILSMQSLYNHLCLRLWKNPIHRLDEKLLEFIVFIQCYQYKVSLFQLAIQYKCSSYKLAKYAIENIHLIQKHEKDDNEDDNEDETIKRKVTKISISMFLEYPNLIKDQWFRCELINAISKDLLCSHIHDQLKECVGKEYEDLLIKKLKQKNLVFETESELRNKGKPKTPDILFLIPMLVTFTLKDSKMNIIQEVTAIVHWIDSKAMFVDHIGYNEHIEQFQGYSNRYGNGLVIYWHGFTQDLCNIMKTENPYVVLCDHFPIEWRFPTGELAIDGELASFMKSKKQMNEFDDEFEVNNQHIDRLNFNRNNS